jgi:hypothetical protein
MSEAARRKLGESESNHELGARLSATPHRSLSPNSRRKLFHLLTAKSLLETLLVAALAVGFYYLVFSPSFRGSVDVADATRVEGWVVDASRPASPVEVQLYLDDRFVAWGFADQPRPDVSAAGWAPDDMHGFRFAIKVEHAGQHEARVYAVHSSAGGSLRTLQQIGKPMRFNAP